MKLYSEWVTAGAGAGGGQGLWLAEDGIEAHAGNNSSQNNSQLPVADQGAGQLE